MADCGVNESPSERLGGRNRKKEKMDEEKGPVLRMNVGGEELAYLPCWLLETDEVRCKGKKCSIFGV